MEMIFDTYEHFKMFVKDSESCPEDFGYNGFKNCKPYTDDCLKCWLESGVKIEIKENLTKSITLQFDLPMCPYWDPITKTARHTCGGCRCLEDGNSIGNAVYGVMADGDRYCCLGDDVDIRAGIVKEVRD